MESNFLSSFEPYTLDHKTEVLLSIQSSMIEKGAEVFALYFDAIEGFEHLAETSHEKKQQISQEIAKGYGITVNESTWNKISQLNGTDPATLGLLPSEFRLSMSDYLARRVFEKRGISKIGNYLLIALYQFWEDLWRSQIASVFASKNKSDIVSDFWGDLGRIRNCLLHKQEIASKDVGQRNKLFKWFNEGDHILIDRLKFEEIILRFRVFLFEDLFSDSLFNQKKEGASKR